MMPPHDVGCLGDVVLLKDLQQFAADKDERDEDEGEGDGIPPHVDDGGEDDKGKDDAAGTEQAGGEKEDVDDPSGQRC